MDVTLVLIILLAGALATFFSGNKHASKVALLTTEGHRDVLEMRRRDSEIKATAHDDSRNQARERQKQGRGRDPEDRQRC